MEQLINKLKKDSDTGELVAVLQNNFSGFSLDFIKNQLENKSVAKNCRRYNDTVKQFALTVYFYSPKTYRFLRQHFPLPSDRTLRLWMSNTNCDVGFLDNVLMFLKNEILTGKKDYLKECALIFDAMSIRKQVLWDKKLDKFVGYTDYGGIITDDTECLATEVLMFQIVSYRNKFKCVIGYFLTNKCSGAVQAQLLKAALIKLYEVGITVRSLTCDGTVTNFSTLKILGCDFSIEGLVTNFKHPACDISVHVIFDACHMLKLARNTMGECNITCEEGIISWHFIRNLHSLQVEIDLKLANSLSMLHVDYKNKKMNVRLAAQVLSSGVADAVEYLHKCGYKNFEGSQATISFIRCMDKLFDMLNSKNLFGKGFKSPLTRKNAKVWLSTFETCENYLKSLKINGTPVFSHTRKTFALGFIITMHSIKNLALEFLQRETDPFAYVLTYKVSQDNLEIFFSLLRGSGGWNNNPNAMQLKWALKKLLHKNSIQASENGNCLNNILDDTHSIFSLCSGKKVPDKSVEVSLASLCDQLSAIDPVISDLQNEILYYISGFITRRILQNNVCVDCTKILLPSSISDHNYAMEYNFQRWTLFVSRGGLILAAQITFQIVQYTEKLFLTQMQFNKKVKNFKLRIVLAVVEEFSNKLHLFKPIHPVLEEFACDDLHEIKLVKKISSLYLETRMKTKAKKMTEECQGTNASMRQKFNKLILFKNV